MYYVTTYPSPVGQITLACNGERLVGLWNEGQKYHGGALPQPMREKGDLAVFDAAKNWLDRYFAGQQPGADELLLAPMGNSFRQGVWEILLQIPYGEVITYGDIAKRMAAKLGRATMSGQAVGGAVGHNPISIIIPCHRVVGTNRSLTGYAGGIATKIRLLELEGVDTTRFSVPKKGTAL